jgi:hypothetical protein
MVQETMGDVLDDAMAEEGSSEQEELIVNQVLDELGINMGESVPMAPSGVKEKEVLVETPSAPGKNNRLGLGLELRLGISKGSFSPR